MNQNYTRIVDRVVAANGKWLEVDDADLRGASLNARRLSLRQAAKVRKVPIETKIKNGDCLARLKVDTRTSELLERVPYSSPITKRVPLKRVAGVKWFRVLNQKDSYATGIDTVFDQKGRLYMLAPGYQVPEHLRKSVMKVNLYVAMTARSQYYLLYIPVREDKWYRTGMAAIRRALTDWVQVIPDSADGYVSLPGKPSYADPDWSKVLPFPVLVASAFNDRVIRDNNHPALLNILQLSERDAAREEFSK